MKTSCSRTCSTVPKAPPSRRRAGEGRAGRPGGRFDARSHMRALAQRQHGLPVTAHSWSIERVRRNPIQAPHVIFILDTSGSMAIYEYALRPVTWILDTAGRSVGGRMATGVVRDSRTQPFPLSLGLSTG